MKLLCRAVEARAYSVRQIVGEVKRFRSSAHASHVAMCAVHQWATLP